MSTERFDFANLELLGDSPCLDLINTFDWRGRVDRTDYLTDFEDLLAWAVHSGLLEGERRTLLQGLTRDDPRRTAGVFRQAIALREAAHRLLTGPAEAADVELVNDLLAGLETDILEPEGLGFRRVRPRRPPRPAELLEPILIALRDLLTTPERRLVKACADDQCGWLFLDRSRNHSRKWCDMADCGNRAKAARFYRRTRSGRRA